jgi:hypothetical protein
MLNAIEPGLYRKYKVNAAKGETHLNITKYTTVYSVLSHTFNWRNTVLYPNHLTWFEVYRILVKQEGGDAKYSYDNILLYMLQERPKEQRHETIHN